MEALVAVFLVSGMAILSVALGVFSAYWVINGLLAALNPARTAPVPALLPREFQASGD